jgi:translation initiation factor IF-2
LAERLEMSPEQAVEKLRYMLFSVDGVDSVISDEEIDILIDVDDDPAVADRYREARLKELDKAKKRTERLKKANEKRRTEKTVQKDETSEAEAVVAPEAVAQEEAAEVETAAVEVEEAEGEAPAKPKATILPREVAPEPVAAPEAAAPVGATPEAAEPVSAESPKPAKKEIPVPDIKIGTAIEKAERTVEIIRADGTLLDVPEAVEEVKDIEAAEEEEEEQGLIAEAERRQEEEELRKAKLAVRPLAKPDPAVVAEVRRRAAERMARQQAQNTAQPGRSAAPPSAPGRPIGVGPGGARPAPGTTGRPAGGPGRREGDRRGGAGAAPAATGGAGVKPGRKKGKKLEKKRGEEALRRDAAATVRGYQAGTLAGPGPRRRKRRRTREEEESGVVFDENERDVIEVKESMTVEELANEMEVGVNDVILALMDHNVLATKNQTLSFELIRQIADALGFDVQSVIPEETEVLAEEPDDPEDLVPRAPVVTVMGHVDHGKTTLLDRIRRTNVAEGEAGGITQHIAAYDVPIGNGRVVFLDTPGHEAFTQMRARGAKVTDIVVLVVAADDGVMPQTIEAIDHAKAAEVTIVVAINKIDKPDAQPDRIRQELTRFELVDEKWGGKTIMKDISAKGGVGITELMELLVLEAELLELKANPKKRARGAIIESEISRGQGPVAWVLVQVGTLRIGDPFLAGEAYGRVRTMHNARGEQLQEAGPATPVVVTGFNSLPNAGDTLVVATDERAARAIAEQRAQISRQKQGQVARRITLEDLQEQIKSGEKHELNVVLKADVQGSVDVFESSLAKVGNEEVRVHIVHSGVGAVNESDVLLASASDAVIIGFNVTANPRVQKQAEHEGVAIRTNRVIYEAIEDVRKALEGLLTPETQEVVTGHAEVRAVFRSSAFGNIAGCHVMDGEITRNSQARIVRDGTVVHTGRVGSLRREKDDAKTVQTGFECGIKLDNFEDVKAGDIIETYRLQSVDRTLA